MFIANNSIFKSIMQYFLARLIALKECYLMMNFEKKIILLFLKYLYKCKFDGSTLLKCDFMEGRLPNFFQEIYSTGGKQTMHKVSAAFIVKNCHPRTSSRPGSSTWSLIGMVHSITFRFTILGITLSRESAKDLRFLLC